MGERLRAAPFLSGHEELQKIEPDQFADALRTVIDGFRAVVKSSSSARHHATQARDVTYSIRNSLTSVTEGSDNPHLEAMKGHLESLDASSRDAMVHTASMSRAGHSVVSHLEAALGIVEKTFAPALGSAATASELSVTHRYRAEAEAAAYVQGITG